MATTIEDLPGEIWKPVVGYEGRYSVSNKGRVLSESRLTTGRGGARPLPARLLKPGAKQTGHCFVALWSDGKARYVLVHRLVLEAFVGTCPEGMECCHNTNDPRDNRVENLRWDTRASNVADAIAAGTFYPTNR